MTLVSIIEPPSSKATFETGSRPRKENPWDGNNLAQYLNCCQIFKRLFYKGSYLDLSAASKYT
jgi:hypothetical protein